ncbi:hypothetical protein MF672_009355 [Actinomadura sp. ATCC 31491]|uniref:Uncharacterized protein n=1 Tax=Actinomadura luzonensis TaxID=2805427 RepID=A0ABT0FNY2_9ACTN|nr:hypothetical protein [Actinomadura luzonensis]MCK2213996.1 hypothetical protein [Actinomadura luzonensis]
MLGRQVAGHVASHDALIGLAGRRPWPPTRRPRSRWRVVPAAGGGLANAGRLGDNVGGQGLAYNQARGGPVDVFGYPAGPHPDGDGPYDGQTIQSARQRRGDLRYATSLSPDFDGETRAVYQDAAVVWTGSIA